MYAKILTDNQIDLPRGKGKLAKGINTSMLVCWLYAVCIMCCPLVS